MVELVEREPARLDRALTPALAALLLKPTHSEPARPFAYFNRGFAWLTARYTGGVGFLLNRAGFTVIEASTGREGLRLFHSARPDLVVLDVAMPEMDGWQALERIRELGDTPVMVPLFAATFPVSVNAGETSIIYSAWQAVHR